MISSEVVQAQPREGIRNKNVARRVRVSGKIPAVVYGAKKESVAVTVDPKQITKILHSKSGHNTIFELQVGSVETTKAMIVDWQYEPINGKVIHIDLKRIAMDQVIRVTVPVHLEGVPEGVKTQGGILEQVLREVEVSCLPADIPTSIDVDVTALVFGQVLRVADLPHGGKLKFLTSENQTIAHVTSVKEVAAAETPVEGAAAAAEPEVIKKGKQDAEGAEAAPAAGAKAPAKK